FTPMCRQLPPAVILKFLNDLFVRFDSVLDAYGVYKVETIGDCYVVAGGLVYEDADGMAAVRGSGEVDSQQTDRTFNFARAMLRSASRVLLPTTGQPVCIRIGIHTGPVVSGVVGTRMPRFCLFGDTMNTASRMESTGVPGCIHVSEETYGMLRPEPGWAPTGGIEVKGKGRMNTYLWRPQQPSASSGPTSLGTTVSPRFMSAASLPR
ncbi:Guanylate cyclase soluble subunit beta-2, partial [Tetrabaena socialis]